MYLRKDTAEKIIKEISQILDYDINIMDEHGAILASTDPTRVGMFHEGAFIIINQKLKELAVYEDNQYEGCRKGINLPISLEDKIIGVIGITGDVDEITKYGNILKKMTEILTLDLFSYHKKSQKEQASLIFINEWINTHSHDFNFSFKDAMNEQGLPSASPYIVCLIRTNEDIDYSVFVKHQTCVCSKIDNTYVIIIASDSVYHIADSIKHTLSISNIRHYTCIISDIAPDYTIVRHVYRQANKLLDLKLNQQGIFVYEENIFELLINDVSPEYKELLIRQTLSMLTIEERSDFTEFMKTYSLCNGSINAIASKLFVHKNTVQYKINKIIQKTGRDPRKLEDFQILMMVALWNEEFKD